jgi:hypothetical protein
VGRNSRGPFRSGDAGPAAALQGAAGRSGPSHESTRSRYGVECD